VALKVLSQRLAEIPDLRQRLEREAKVISSLNRPRICTLYDIGRDGEVDYLVMEFLEGETLAQPLKRGRFRCPRCWNWPGRLPTHWRRRLQRALCIAI
jgi:serine/threonine protein kinase